MKNLYDLGLNSRNFLYYVANDPRLSTNQQLPYDFEIKTFFNGTKYAYMPLNNISHITIPKYLDATKKHDPLVKALGFHIHFKTPSFDIQSNRTGDYYVYHKYNINGPSTSWYIVHKNLNSNYTENIPNQIRNHLSKEAKRHILPIINFANEKLQSIRSEKLSLDLKIEKLIDILYKTDPCQEKITLILQLKQKLIERTRLTKQYEKYIGKTDKDLKWDTYYNVFTENYEAYIQTIKSEITIKIQEQDVAEQASVICHPSKPIQQKKSKSPTFFASSNRHKKNHTTKKKFDFSLINQTTIAALSEADTTQLYPCVEQAFDLGYQIADKSLSATKFLIKYGYNAIFSCCCSKKKPKKADTKRKLKHRQGDYVDLEILQFNQR